jgi:hypothetical protein
VNVSNDSCVGEVDECVIYESVVDRARVEDSEVGVFDTQRMEVWVRESSSM